MTTNDYLGRIPILRRNVGLSEKFKTTNPSLLEIPPEDSFFFRAFNKNIAHAESVLNSRYLQSMITTSLPPDNYGCLTVLDSYYCYRAADSYATALCNVDRAKEPELYTILKDLKDGYESYNSTFFDYWHIRTSESVNPTEYFKQYAEHEHMVACSPEPIYTLAVMIPCYYLWYWFATEMKKNMTGDELYYPWVAGCAEYPSSAYAIGNFIESWVQSGKDFDEDTAMKYYSASMGYEDKIFNDAYKEENKNEYKNNFM